MRNLGISSTSRRFSLNPSLHHVVNNVLIPKEEGA